MDYNTIFNHLHPDFFKQDYIRSLPPEEIFDEQVLALADFRKDALKIDCPEHITFGFYQGELPSLHAAIRVVEDDWVQWFESTERVFCAFDGDKVVSFCNLDDCGVCEGMRIGAPGCVGTIPGYRKQGIGLRMVQLATAELQKEGYDLSWIHYTAVGHWYARLGYKTVLRWNCNGIVK